MQLRLPHVTDTKARFEAKPQTKKHDDIDPDESERNTVLKDISFSVKEWRRNVKERMDSDELHFEGNKMTLKNESALDLDTCLPKR